MNSSPSPVDSSSSKIASPPEDVSKGKDVSLPPEILMKIFQLAVNSCETVEQQLATKLSCAQVCRSWWIASEVGVEYIVNSTKKAVELAEWLKETHRGDSVRSLDISWQGRGKERSQQLAKLIESCPNITSISFFARFQSSIDHNYLGKEEQHDVLGPNVRASLGRLHSLQSFSFDGDGLEVDCSSILQYVIILLDHEDRLLTLRLRLRRSLSPNANLSQFSFTRITYDEDAGLEVNDFQSLHEATSITWRLNFVSVIIDYIDLLPLPTVTTLILGSPMVDHGILLLPRLSRIAPQLVHLELMDGPWNAAFHKEGSYFNELTSSLGKVFQKLTRVETLQLGLNLFDPSEVVKLTSQDDGAFPQLRNLRIGMNPYSSVQRLKDFNLDDVIELMRGLGKLQRIRVWSEEQINKYEEVAEELGVVVEWNR